MRIAGTAVVLCLLLFAPAATAGWDDDAGSGRDAGESMATALEILPGDHHGEIASGDGWNDAYKVAIPHDTYLHVELWGNDCWIYFVDPADPSTEISPASYSVDVLAIDTTARSNGFAYFILNGCGTYDMRVSVRPSPDFRAASIAWEEIPVRTAPDGTEFSHLRKVTVDVANDGAGTSELLIIIEAQHGNDIRRVATRTLAGISPGGTTRIEATWDQTGEIGDGVLRLVVISQLDSNPTNNIRESEAFVIAGGLGIGADVLNQRIVVAPLAALSIFAGDLHLGVYHHEQRVGVYAARYTHDFFTDYSAAEWARVELPASGLPTASICLRGSFDACPDPEP